MPQVEQIPEGAELLELIQRNAPWDPVYRKALEEVLWAAPIRAALREVLLQSDEMLKNIGMADLTNEDTIKKSLRSQGVAQGLVQAVELLCTLATTPEEKLDA